MTILNAYTEKMAVLSRVRIKSQWFVAIFKILLAICIFGFINSEIVKADDNRNNKEEFNLDDWVYKRSEPNGNRYKVREIPYTGGIKLVDENGLNIYVNPDEYAKLNNCTGRFSLICVGDKVYSAYKINIYGNVIAISKNSFDSVVFQDEITNKIYTEREDSLIREISGCTDTKPNICRGDKVVQMLFPKDFAGTVSAILSDRTFVLFNEIDGNTYVRARPSNYAKVNTKECTKEPIICVGDKVYDILDNKIYGNVFAINQNTAVFQNIETSKVYSKDAKFLIKKVSGCTDTTPNICEGDKVVQILFPEDFAGTVSEILSDRTFVLFNEIDGKTYVHANPRNFDVKIQGIKPAIKNRIQ